MVTIMRFLLALPLLLLAACGDTVMADLMRPVLGGPAADDPAGEAMPRSRLPAPAGDGLPAEPALSVRQGSRRVVAVMIEENGERRLWRSPDGLVVATDGARVTATAGTRTYLAATRLDGPDPLDDPTALAERPATLRRWVDLMRPDRSPDHMRFGLGLECRLRAARSGEALLVEERCGGGASFINRYWAVPETGAIWRSEQWVGEERPMVIEVLTPPAS